MGRHSLEGGEKVCVGLPWKRKGGDVGKNFYEGWKETDQKGQVISEGIANTCFQN